MRPGLSALATWNPAGLGAAAETVTDLRTVLDRAAADTEQSAAWTRRGWDSPAADVAFAQIGAAQISTARLAALCGEMAAALSTAQSAVSRARDDAIEAAASAQGEGFEVSDRGAVTPSAAQIAAASSSDGEAGSAGVELERRARAHADAIAAALDAVDSADLAAKAAIDRVCSKLYETPTPPLGVVSTDLPPTAAASGPGWEFDPSVNPRTMAASAVIGTMAEGIRMGAANELRGTPDPVLQKMFGGFDDAVNGQFGKKVLQGVSRAGGVAAVGGAIPAIKDNIDSGMDTPTAVTSELVGAGAGLFAGAAAGAAFGVAGGPVGIVGGLIVGAIASSGASLVASKLVQATSRSVQDG